MVAGGIHKGMAQQFYDHVFETCSGNPGSSGNFALNGPVAGMQGWVVTSGNTSGQYVATDNVNWETGVGVWSGGQIKRTNVQESSNNNLNVNFSGSNINVMMVPTASFLNTINASGSIQSGMIALAAVNGVNIASGTITQTLLASGVGGGGGASLTSGVITSGLVGNGAIVSGSIASGQIDTYHMASGATITRAQYLVGLTSGGTFTANAAENISGMRAVSMNLSGQLQIAMASVPSRMPAIGVVHSNVASGLPCNVYQVGGFMFSSGLGDFSGNLGQAIYVGRSGQIVTASGSFNSGGFASGDYVQTVGTAGPNSGAFVFTLGPAFQYGPLVLSSGVVGSGAIANAAIVSGSLASGIIAQFALASGAVNSGHIGSGAVMGRNVGWSIASGSIGPNDMGSGAIISGLIASGQVGFGHLANGSVKSGTIAAAVIGTPHIANNAITNALMASGAVTSGNIASGQIGLFHMASGFAGWSGGGGAGLTSGSVSQFFMASGAVNSGHVSSGAVLGSLGGGAFTIASGTIGTNDIGNGQILSGNIGSGQIGNFHLSITPQICFHTTEEPISGFRAVCMSQSGNLRVAMASVSGRMPAIGFTTTNVLSGASMAVIVAGKFQLSSGMADYSGFLGAPVYIGRSGQFVTASGSFNSGGFASGDWIQEIGVPYNSGGLITNLNPMAFQFRS